MSNPFQDSPLRIYCYNCNSYALKQETQYGRRDLCTSCGHYSWGGKPLQSPHMHNLKKRCHQHFDKLWKNGILSRTKAYEALAEQLNIPVSTCHIASLGEELLLQIPPAIQDILSALYSPTERTMKRKIEKTRREIAKLPEPEIFFPTKQQSKPQKPKPSFTKGRKQ